VIILSISSVSIFCTPLQKSPHWHATQARSIQTGLDETVAKVDQAATQLLDARYHADKSASECELRAQKAAAAAEALRQNGLDAAHDLSIEAEQAQQEEISLRGSAQVLKDKVRKQR
jgi:uncharacterized membrane protein